MTKHSLSDAQSNPQSNPQSNRLPSSLLSYVTEFHHQLNEAFLLHQEALLINALPLAADFLSIFQELITLHIAVENEHINPVHAELINDARWKTTLYVAEHDKILSLINNLSDKLSDKMQQSATLPEHAQERSQKTHNRWVIDILDYERTLKNVMEHHEEREEKGLLAEIDEQLSATPLNALIETCHSHWHEPLQKQQDSINTLTLKLRALEQ